MKCVKSQSSTRPAHPSLSSPSTPASTPSHPASRPRNISSGAKNKCASTPVLKNGPRRSRWSSFSNCASFTAASSPPATIMSTTDRCSTDLSTTHPSGARTFKGSTVSSGRRTLSFSTVGRAGDPSAAGSSLPRSSARSIRSRSSIPPSAPGWSWLRSG